MAALLGEEVCLGVLGLVSTTDQRGGVCRVPALGEIVEEVELAPVLETISSLSAPPLTLYFERSGCCGGGRLSRRWRRRAVEMM